MPNSIHEQIPAIIDAIALLSTQYHTVEGAVVAKIKAWFFANIFVCAFINGAAGYIRHNDTRSKKIARSTQTTEVVGIGAAIYHGIGGGGSVANEFVGNEFI